MFERDKLFISGLVIFIVCVISLSKALAGFPETPPNDPDFGAGLATWDDLISSADLDPNEVEYYFYSFLPGGAPFASDPEGASGMSVDRAWREFGIGREDVIIAYVEGGINWHDGSIEELADKIYINPGELPPPPGDNGDGWFNAPDYDTQKMREEYGLGDHNGNGFIDAEDLIVTFSNGVDDDGNGYIDDISGWDFYNDQNDPATYDVAYGHPNGQMEQAAAITDNGIQGAGICPRAMLMPIKAGAEALDCTDDLARAWLFAADTGADVIVSTTADLGYSTFIREAIDYITRNGVVIVESSNDFNSTDHQGGMFHANVLPGNGLVPDSKGGLSLLTTTYRARSCITSWGTQNMFSVPTRGGTTSESTPTLGGTIAMVKSGADDAYDEGFISWPLTGFELIQVLRSTCSDIDDPRLAWSGKSGWDLQYGYGRPNVYKAIKAIRDHNIPPVAIIDSPRWFSIIDPEKDEFVPVIGRVSAQRSSGCLWELQVAAGPEPDDDEFIKISSGCGDEGGVLGSLDMDALKGVYASFYKDRFSLSKELETTEKYTMTLRLRVWDDEGRLGEDRRSIFVLTDKDWHDPFPKFIGPGGEGQACLVDLQGQGRLAIVFGDSDGFIHAIDSASGEELPGWPVHTLPTEVVKSHTGVNPYYEPLISPVSVGDLDHDGDLWVVATSTTGRVYVFDSSGKLRDGWPCTLDVGLIRPSIPREKRPYTRLPIQGATAPPVLFDLDGDEDLEIIQAAWDGYLYIFHADGSYLLGWPKKVELSEDTSGRFVRINDHKLITPPAIADLDGDGNYEIVIRPQLGDTRGSDIQLNCKIHVIAYDRYGRMVYGWPVDLKALAIIYGTAQEFITEGSNSPVSADVDGDGDDEVVVSPLMSSPYLLDGDGSVMAHYMDKGAFDLLENAGTIVEILTKLGKDQPVSFTTAGAFGQFDGSLAYAQAGSGIQGILMTQLTPGKGIWLKNYERAYDALTGEPKQGFPAFFQGLDFLSAPVIADVTGDGKAEIIDGGDSSALHAYTRGGRQAEGFPKFTTGWKIWSPSVGDIDSDGDVEVVTLTREGYLMIWDTRGCAEANNQWWHYSHDEWHTGRYGTDTRPPGILRDLMVDNKTREIHFLAPGDDWYAGKAAGYRVTFMHSGNIVEFAANVPAGGEEILSIPEGVSEVSIQAFDDAGNIGKASMFSVRGIIPEENPPPSPASSDSDDNGLCFISTAVQ